MHKHDSERREAIPVLLLILHVHTLQQKEPTIIMVPFSLDNSTMSATSEATQTEPKPKPE